MRRTSVPVHGDAVPPLDEAKKLLTRLTHRRILYPVLFLGLVFLNVMVALAALHAHQRHRQSLLDGIRLSVRQSVQAEAARLRTVGGLPPVMSVLVQAQREAAGGLEGANGIAEQWPLLGRDEMAVREILDNNVSDVLGCPGVNPDRRDLLLLTDAGGRVVAASEKPPLYRYTGESWWKQARTAEPGSVVSEGLTAGGRLGLAMPLRAKVGNRTGEGVLRLEVSPARIGVGLASAAESNTTAVAIMARTAVLIAGSPDVFGKAFSWLDSLGGGRDLHTWRAGIRAAARPLDGGVAWTEPVSVIVLRQEPLLPRSVVMPVAGCAVITIVMIMFYALAARANPPLVSDAPMQELLEAGDWILHTALGRPSALTEGLAASPDGKPFMPEASPLQRELQQWLYRLLQDLHEEYTSRSFEMERDLSLARDFQLAYMQRAYPKVPAVHVEGRLRLDFYHRYEPALALGGDFYNILTLAPDVGGVFVADVMGHGTRSALITAIIRTLIDDLASQGRNARHFLTEMNKQFCGLLKSVPHPLFASAFYFVADTTSRVATYSSAGHPAPFQVRRSVGRITRMEVPMPRGAALGMIPNETYTGGYSRLIDGDLFIFFTDGVYEAHNVQGEEFGMARMEQAIRSLMYKSTKEIVDGLMEAITTFVSYEPIADDICIVAVEVTTKTAAV